MVALCHRPKGGRTTPFGLGFLAFLLAPTPIGSQELAALIARQPVAAERPQARPATSPFRIIQTATFNTPNLSGMAMPAAMNYVLAGLDPANADITNTIRERMLGEAAAAEPPSKYPTVD